MLAGGLEEGPIDVSDGLDRYDTTPLVDRKPKPQGPFFLQALLVCRIRRAKQVVRRIEYRRDPDGIDLGYHGRLRNIASADALDRRHWRKFQIHELCFRRLGRDLD